MSAKGIFTPILAVFQNGFCYEYIPGNPFLTSNDSEVIINEDQLRLIFAHGMANIHSVVVPQFDYKHSALFEFAAEMISGVNSCFKGCPSKEELLHELRLVEELVSIVRSPLVHLHGYPHLANMVWNDQQKKVTYVDWELSQVGPRAYDIAFFFNCFDNFFNSFGCIVNIPVKTPPERERKFCVHYLERWNELCGQPNPTQDEVEQLLQELKYFLLVVNVVRMVLMFKFAEVTSNFGKMESNWQYTFNRYITMKDELFGIKTFGRLTTELKPSKRAT